MGLFIYSREPGRGDEHKSTGFLGLYGLFIVSA
jgi:hypothetical protein